MKLCPFKTDLERARKRLQDVGEFTEMSSRNSSALRG